MKLLKFTLLGLIAAFMISCDKDEDIVTPAYTIDDFVGSWKATSAVYTNNTDPSESIDLITLGAEIRFTVLEHGGSRTWFVFGPIDEEWDSSSELLDDNTMVTTPVETTREPYTLDFEFEDENTLRMTNHDDKFDFTLTEGAPLVSATSEMVFKRQ